MSSNKISRRALLGMAAGAAAAVATPGLDWVYTRDKHGAIVFAQSGDVTDWRPKLFTEKQAEAVAAVAEAIIPRTETPGARDVRVHEFIDLQLSGESESQQKMFLEGLDWLEARCRKEFRSAIADADEETLHALLDPISDRYEGHGEDLKVGANFFGNIKRRTIFGYYTSREGWTQELGLDMHPSLNATFEGCSEA